MAEFDTKYHGYALRYNTDKAEWYCPELELAAPQLKSLRTLIDKGNLDKRRVDVTALRLKSDYSFNRRTEPTIERVSITTLASATAGSRECWIKTTTGREKEYLSNLFEDTAEANAAITKWRRALAEARAAMTAAEALKEAIPRVKVPKAPAPTDASA